MQSPNAFLLVQNLSLFIITFVVAFVAAPVLIRLLYRYRAWKKKPRETTIGGAATPIFAKLHAHKEVNTPRMGGILIWGTVLVVTLVTWIAHLVNPDSFLGALNFVSRSQTWLPLFTLASASLLGLVDDLLVINERGGYVAGGLQYKVRMGLIVAIALIGAWWFHGKLGWSSINVPFYGDVTIGIVYVALFVIVVLATFSSSIVDGLDGLSAGVLIPIFIAYGAIAFALGLYDLVAFLTVLVGALVTYLWFNVHPAKFYMGETGIMGLTVTLAVIAFLTNAVLLLPIIAIVLVAESGSAIVQLLSKRFLKRKIFLSAPLHHHFEALGWPESQVTMRFWIVSGVASALGILLFFLSRFFS